ncbi:MAG: LysR substrate-binding domain-containing protein [Rubrobacter sp.]
MSGVSLQGLRMFLAVVEHGSVSEAGRELGVSQPAVSGHLHSLEERYGVVLLDRGRPMRLTPAGETLARHARRVLTAHREMEEEMSQQSEPRGDLEVGASTTPAQVVIPRVVTGFAERYPAVNLKVRVGDTKEILVALKGREIEVAVVGLLPDAVEFESHSLEEDRLAVIVAAGSGEVGFTLQKLAGCTFILREEGSATRRAIEEVLSEHSVHPKPVMELGSNAAIVGAVAEGAGVGVVPEGFVSGESRVRSVAVEGLAMSRPLVLVSERGRQLSSAAKAFVKLCVEGSQDSGKR